MPQGISSAARRIPVSSEWSTCRSQWCRSNCRRHSVLWEWRNYGRCSKGSWKEFTELTGSCSQHEFEVKQEKVEVEARPSHLYGPFGHILRPQAAFHESGGHCKHASTRRQESSSTPARMCQLSFQIYANYFRSVWTTTQINREECPVCVGKSARRSIPIHQVYDQIDTSAQILWCSQWNHHPMWCIRVWPGSYGVCLKVIVSCRAPLCTKRKRVLGDSFRMQPFQSVPTWKRIIFM